MSARIRDYYRAYLDHRGMPPIRDDVDWCGVSTPMAVLTTLTVIVVGLAPGYFVALAVLVSAQSILSTEIVVSPLLFAIIAGFSLLEGYLSVILIGAPFGDWLVGVPREGVHRPMWEVGDGPA